MKNINKDQRINGKESSHVILYSDDYDGLDNSKFNTKVCMLTFWTGYLYFPGGEVINNQITFEDNIIQYVKRILDFDISKYKNEFEHISSFYISENNAVHTYALKIEKLEMAKLQMKVPKFDENGDPDEESALLLDTCGINKFNVSLDTLNFVMKNNFGPGVKENFIQFVDKYINKKIENEREFIKNIKNAMELKIIEDSINSNKNEILSDLREILSVRGLEYLLDKNDERFKNLIDENGNLKDEDLNKLFLSESTIMNEIFGMKDIKTNKNFDFKQKSW